MEITPFIQRKGNRNEVADPNVTGRIRSSRDGGNPPPYLTNSFMESRFETDFLEYKYIGITTIRNILTAKRKDVAHYYKWV